MLAHPPHILVTTPESLYILLTAEKSRAILGDVETVIVDEIHAVADDKRGAHLALSLERLEALVAQSRPDRAAGAHRTFGHAKAASSWWPGSWWEAAAAEPVIVNIGHRRALDLAVEVPRERAWAYRHQRNVGRGLRPAGGTGAAAPLDAGLCEHAAAVGARWRITWRERLGADAVAAHHGSLARKVRLAAENRLKSGEVRVLVATASLELGIDIGTVDLVCQIGSPRSIAVALQRIGRSGHWRGAVPKGRLFATTRDELIECAALVRALRAGRTRPAGDSGSAAWTFWPSRSWRCARARTGVRRSVRGRAPGLPLPRSGPRRNLTRCSRCFRRESPPAAAATAPICIATASSIACEAGAAAAWWPSPTAARFRSPRFTPWWRSRKATWWARWLRTLRSKACAATSSCWATRPGASRRIEGSSGRVLVEDAHGAAPNIPFWLGEAPARTPELSAQVAEIREKISDLSGQLKRSEAQLPCRRLRRPQRTPDALQGASRQSAASPGLKEQCGLDDAGAEQAVEYILARARRAGRGADSKHHHCRALFRRRRRHAACDPRALWRQNQQSLGTGAAQAVLPLLQF